LKNLLFFNSKLNGRKLGFNTPLRVSSIFHFEIEGSYLSEGSGKTHTQGERKRVEPRSCNCDHGRNKNDAL